MALRSSPAQLDRPPETPGGRLLKALALIAGLAGLAGLDLALALLRLQHPVPGSELPLAAILLRWLAFALPALLVARFDRSPSRLPAVLAGTVLAVCLGLLLTILVPAAGAARPGWRLAVPLLVGVLAGFGAWLVRPWPWRSLGAALVAWLVIGIWAKGLPRVLQSHPPPSEQPDLLLITLDTWREDSLSASPRALVPSLTPTLDALAGSGCRVDGAMAPAPLTGPSHAAMLSGRTPLELEVLLNGDRLPAEGPWLPERLREQGYRTAAFVSSAMLDAELGFGRGFDVYDDDLAGRAAMEASSVGSVWRPRRRSRGFDRDGRETIARMETWLRRSGSKAEGERPPLFLWLHLYDAHRPYQPTKEALARVGEIPLPLPPAEAYASHPAFPEPKEPKRTSMARRLMDGVALPDRQKQPEEPDEVARYYLAGVHDLDGIVAEALSVIDQHQGQRARAWAIVGDHGESLTEHGEIGSHQDHLYEANLRVPLLLSPGGDCPTGPLSTRGLAGSLLSRAGLSSEDFPSLGPTLPLEAWVIGRSHAEKRRVGKMALREGDTKVIAGSGRDGAAAFVEAYDLSVDPHEIQPLSEAPAPLVGRVEGELEQMRPRRKGGIPAETRTALEALGYIE